ncbi:MAG: phenylalanine 4-monooxygenase [Gemmatimonadaceae bacterium]|nr:phenylalanine 4-monooxygenase [Gemmatimonadaceae bacterium]
MLTVTPPALAEQSFPTFVAQAYDGYDAEAHAVWSILTARRIAALASTASEVYLRGADRIGLSTERVPELADINARLARLTGWAAIGVTGFIPAPHFFRCLSHRLFPTTLSVRPRAQLDYLPEPDIFHDVFGHVPLHADPTFAAFLEQFGALALRARDPEAVTALPRLFWFTVEFGLVRERGTPRIYGSGLISSHADAAHALSASCDRRPFALDDVIAQPFEIDHVQPILFMLEDFGQLFDAVRTLAARYGLERPQRAA